MNERVAIVGTGKTRFGELFSQSYADLVVEATQLAYADAGVTQDDIEAAWLGAAFAYTYSEEGNAGTSLAEPLELYDRPVSRVSNYCATGMDAIRHGVMAVRAGEYEMVLVVGAEKMRDVGPRQSLLAQHIERGHPTFAKGRTAPGIFGLIARRYSEVYGDPRSAMTQVAIKNHWNGARNPSAHFQSELTVEQVEGAAPVSGMLRLFDCCPTTDGAAAVIITTESRARELRPDDYVIVHAMEIAATTGYFSAQSDPSNDFLGFSATRSAARTAYAKAGILDPSTQVSLAEVHDCFTITEIVNYEDLGFVNPGKGASFVLEGQTAVDGRLPVNASGGLQSCGHPIGATGVRVVVDLADQLRGRAGARQVAQPDVGVGHTLGGPGSVAAVGVVARPEWTPRQ